MALDDLMRGGRTPPVQLRTVAAVVTASSEAGIFVTPVGQSADHPVGPCRGIRTRTTPAGDRMPLPAGAHVLVIFTDSGPWILAVDE